MVAKKKWFRSWHGDAVSMGHLAIARDAKVSGFVVQAIVWTLQDYASQNQPRGSVAGFQADHYAAWADLKTEAVMAVIEAMKAHGVIVDDRFADWSATQPTGFEDSAPRVAQHRARKKAEAENKPAEA